MAKIILSAQNFDIYDGDGLDPAARTGATSIEQLHQAGATGIVIGHSEVGDNPAVVRKKLLSALKNNELPDNTILVGETWEEFDGHSVEEVSDTIGKQTRIILEGVDQGKIKNMVLGYEPKWGSRGSGRDDQPPPSSELVGTCAERIHSVLANMGAESVPIIYGGRSTPERTESILAHQKVDGLILGSACNSVEKILAIADAMTKAKGNGKKILHANFKAYKLQDSYEQYLEALSALDDSFVVYLSPPHTDIRLVKKLMKQ